MNGKASYGQPAVVGGLVMGVLSALPLIAAGNLCCCLWVLSGGAVAAYLLQQNQAEPIQPGDAALVGLLAGLIGAVVQVVLSIPINLVVGPYERQLLERFIDMAGSMPPDLRNMIEESRRSAQNGALFIVGKVFALMLWLVLGAIFSTIGGLLGGLVFKKTPPPAPPAG